MIPTAAILIAGFPVAWWLIGDLSEPDHGSGLDHNFGRIEIDPRIETAVAMPALIVAVIAATMLLKRRADGTLPRWWIVSVSVLTIANVLAASFARVLTAGTHGANIGGGLVVLFGGPILLGAYGVGFVLLVGAARSEE